MAPNGASCKNFRTGLVIDFERAKKRLRPAKLEPPHVVRLVEQAVEFQRRLATGEARFRADLARRSGLSAMRVTQVLGLLELAPELLEYVRTLPPGTPQRTITERGLRALTKLSREEQLARAKARVTGFAAYLARRRLAAGS